MPRRHAAVVAAVWLTATASAAASTGPCGRWSFTESTVETDRGVELFVREGGSGEPAVVVPGDFLLFDHLCSLAAGRRVVFYDMRNRGRSSPVEQGESLSLDADLQDLEAILVGYGLERPALVGYSYLGHLVVRFALEHPGTISRIVQLGAVPMDLERTFPPTLAEPALAVSGELAGEIGRLRTLRAEGLHESDPAAYCELEWEVTRNGLVGDPARAAGLVDRCDLPNEWPTRLAFHMQHHFLDSMRHAVVTAAEAASLEIPVLTVHGTRDRNAPYGGGREWAAALPGSRLLTVEGAGHAIHAEVDLPPILETFLGGRWPAGTEAVESAADGQGSQLEAWDLLRAALARHAPQGVMPGRAFRAAWRGTLRARSQSRTSEPPFEPPFPVAWEVAMDAGRERLSVVEELQWPSFVSRFRSVVTPGDAFDVDLGSGAVSPPFRAPRELLASVIRRLPPLLLAEMLEESPGSVRFDGVVTIDGRALHALSGIHRGERIDLYLEPAGDVAALGRMVHEPMFGDAYETVRLEGSIVTAGLELPARVATSREGAGVGSDLELLSFAWAEVGPSDFARPSVPMPGEGPEADLRSSSAQEGVESLASSVFLVGVPERPDYRSLVVERADHLVLVEAPLDEGATNDLLTLLVERFDGKPVKWVITTHHHFDHSGGVPAALRSGAKLVTTAGNVGFFRRAMTSPRTLAGQAAPSDPPEIVTVEEAWRVPGGPPEVEVWPVEPNEHAAEMLVVHLPGPRLLFQGDLVRFPLDPAEPPRSQVRSLLQLVEEGELEVERIAGVHGAVGNLESLRSSLGERP